MSKADHVMLSSLCDNKKDNVNWFYELKTQWINNISFSYNESLENKWSLVNF